MAMLKVVRNALATTIDQGMQGRSRVVPYKPRSLDIPGGDGIFIYIAPDQSSYVEPWLSFDPQQWAHLRYSVTVCVPDNDAGRAHDLLDDLVDPTINAANVFTSIYNSPHLGITAFTVDAQPMFAPITAGERMVQGDPEIFFYELTFPVHVVVQTPTS